MTAREAFLVVLEAGQFSPTDSGKEFSCAGDLVDCVAERVFERARTLRLEDPDGSSADKLAYALGQLSMLLALAPAEFNRTADELWQDFEAEKAAMKAEAPKGPTIHVTELGMRIADRTT